MKYWLYNIRHYPYRRSIRFFFQRLTRGWDDSETWSLDGTFARMILPRLKRFKELTNGYPDGLTFEEWKSIIQTMIEAFEFYAGEKRFDCNQEDFDKAQIGMDLFAKFYIHLWW